LKGIIFCRFYISTFVLIFADGSWCSGWRRGWTGNVMFFWQSCRTICLKMCFFGWLVHCAY